MSQIMYSEVTVKMMKDVALAGSISDDLWLKIQYWRPLLSHVLSPYKILINV